MKLHAKDIAEIQAIEDEETIDQAAKHHLPQGVRDSFHKIRKEAQMDDGGYEERFSPKRR